MDRTSGFSYISQRSDETRGTPPETTEGKISTTIRRKTRETEVKLEYENVGPEGPGKIAVVLILEVKGDFSHHVIEDAMIALNDLAERKGCGHRIV